MKIDFITKLKLCLKNHLYIIGIILLLTYENISMNNKDTAINHYLIDVFS